MHPEKWDDAQIAKIKRMLVSPLKIQRNFQVTAPICNSLIINEAGEGNRTFVKIPACANCEKADDSPSYFALYVFQTHSIASSMV